MFLIVLGWRWWWWCDDSGLNDLRVSVCMTLSTSIAGVGGGLRAAGRRGQGGAAEDGGGQLNKYLQRVI